MAYPNGPPPAAAYNEAPRPCIAQQVTTTINTGPHVQATAWVQPTVTVRPYTPSDVRPGYMGSCVKGLSITLLVLGAISILCQIVDICLQTGIAPVGAGIIAGIVYIIIGILGFLSSKRKTTCLIVTFMTLAIVGTIMSLFPIVTGAIGWGTSDGEKELLEADIHVWWNPQFYHDRQGGISLLTARIAMNAMILFAGLINMILLIVASGLACHGLCWTGNTRGAVIVPSQAMMTSGGGLQQTVIVPQTYPQHQHQHQQQPLTIPATQQYYAGQPLIQGGMSGPSAPMSPPPYGQHINPPQYLPVYK